MKFKFNIKIEGNDYYEFNKYHIYNTRLIKRRMMVTRILLPIFIIEIAFLMGRALHSPEISNIVYGIFIIMAITVFFFYNQITNLSLKWNIKKARETGRLYNDNEITYEFSEDSFIEVTRDSESVIKYSMIDKISSGTSAFYLYINAQSAYIVPYRVFANDQERKGFLDFIENKLSDTLSRK